MVKSSKKKLGATALSVETEPMEARLAETLPEGEDWSYERKWDGFRCLVFKNGTTVDLRAKSGKPLGRYFPEVIAFIASVDVEQFVIDGEMVIERDGHLSFDALQMRLHPAESRIQKLSKETPARFVAFDILMNGDGKVLMESPLAERRQELQAFGERIGRSKAFQLSPPTLKLSEAAQWLSDSGGDTDGVVCKRLSDHYQPGERAMVKVKRIRTADCVVGGFRYEKDSKLVGSLLLGLYNEEGKLDHVGFTSAISDSDRAQMTAKLEALQQAPGFTGKAPGGPSRWSTERSTEWVPLRPELVVEVKYDQITGRRFRHGTKIVRWRPDKKPTQCKFEQIA
ncbi:ATP-dependent DNA ligase (plasmid) [Rhizobium leguminosarum]|uniref:ATP-dependent DNA ligase n=1 Tax=Rhizobium leguminosarum TaxID=384 RepID=UPI0010314CC4|nr:ATP-dependent DNA ligase [Rhizobium leguminosarum]TAY27678.1 ATP-dependent DNA ligase [Rhizobium leguminosarum]